jgi:ATP-dependent Clp protease ATP-binding subunit ClpC
VGYNEGGQLTEQVRRRPYSVVLFDEIEKAHPDVFNVLLQVLEDGHMTDSTGRKVDFRNTVIVMTSNVGARRIGKNITLGFQRKDAGSEYREMRNRVMDEVKKVFNPEFLNRVDEVVVFQHLNHDDLLAIVDIQVAEVIERVREKGLELSLTPEAKEFLIRVGSDEQYGARPLRRAVQQFIEDPLSEMLLRGAFGNNARIEVFPSSEEEKLHFELALPVAEGVTN